MTAAVAAALLILAVADGAFAGFRSSVGRTGLISHRQSDYQAARRGAGLACLLLAPVIAVVCAEAVRPAALEDYARAGKAMFAIYGPSALLVLIALGGYTVLNWRLRYLASALILGPFTLLRPAVAVLGAAVGALESGDAIVAASVVLAVIAVLAVEPLAGRLWYSQAPRMPVTGDNPGNNTGSSRVPRDAAGS